MSQSKSSTVISISRTYVIRPGKVKEGVDGNGQLSSTPSGNWSFPIQGMKYYGHTLFDMKRLPHPWWVKWNR